MYDDEEKPDLDKEIRSKKATTTQDTAAGKTSDTDTGNQAIVASMVGFWTDEIARANARGADSTVVSLYRRELEKWARKLDQSWLRRFEKEDEDCKWTRRH